MSKQDLTVSVQYKTHQNQKIHKDELKRGKTAQKLYEQLNSALRLLQTAPDQSQDFQREFERCAR